MSANHSYDWAPKHNSRIMYDRYRAYVEKQQAAKAAQGPEKASGLSAGSPPEAEALGFADLVDIINPLHHLPLVGSIYRAVTGDQISDAARVMGGGLYGGPAGLALNVAQVAFHQETGHNIDKPIAAMLGQAPAEPQLAEAAAETGIPTAPLTPGQQDDFAGIADEATAAHLAHAAVQEAPVVAVASEPLPAIPTMAEAPPAPPPVAPKAPSDAGEPAAPIRRRKVQAAAIPTLKPASPLDVYRTRGVPHERLPQRTPVEGLGKPRAQEAPLPPQSHRDIEPSAELVASLLGADTALADAAQPAGGPEAPLPVGHGSHIPAMRAEGQPLGREEALHNVLEAFGMLSMDDAFPAELPPAQAGKRYQQTANAADQPAHRLDKRL